MLPDPAYRALVERRRAFALPGYTSYSEAGLDGPWITPYQIAAGNPDGPVLLTYNFLDAPSALKHRDELLAHGFIAAMPFNRVLDLALVALGRTRADLYVTHSFHLLPATRSAVIPGRDIDRSFDAIARHEVAGRRVLALGQAASAACRRHGIAHASAAHLSARGESFSARAKDLVEALCPLF